MNIVLYCVWWCEYRENYKFIVVKFVDVDSFGDDEFDCEGWWVKAEDFIIVGGSARKKKGYEIYCGLYEWVVLCEGMFGLVVKSDKMFVVFLVNLNVGLYDVVVLWSVLAKVFTRSSKRYEISRDGIFLNVRI